MTQDEDQTPETYAKITIKNGKLIIIGDGTIDCAIHTKIIEAILKLPPTGGSRSALSIKSIVDRFSSRTKRSFDSIIRLDAKLQGAYDKIAALPVGHTIKANEVGDEIIIGIPPISVLIFADDGRRFVSRETRKYDNLETIEEFENRTGLSVLDWLRKDANKIVEKIRRAVALLESKPMEYLVDTVTKDEKGNMIAETIKVTLYSEEQVYLSAQRKEKSVMNITPVNPTEKV
jgi:hypothetical protein